MSAIRPTLTGRLQGIEEFMAVAEHGNFVRAATALGLTGSGVGKAVARLEKRLNVRLFQRTTRKVNLTVEGQAFLIRCKSMVAGLFDAEDSVEQRGGAPQGVLRIDMPVAYGRIVIMPILAAFKARYPNVDLHLQLTDRVSDLVDDRLDVVFRLGELGDSSLVARPFDRIHFGAYASPDFLHRHAAIVHPHDLAAHERLCFTLTNGRPFDFRFERGGEVLRLPAGSGLVSNDIEAVLEAAVHGMGVAFLPTFLANAVRDKALCALLPEWQVTGPPVHLMVASGRHMARRVRAFVDFALANLPGASEGSVRLANNGDVGDAIVASS